MKMNARTCEALPSVNEGLGPGELTLFHLKVGPSKGCFKGSESPLDLILPPGKLRPAKRITESKGGPGRVQLQGGGSPLRGQGASQ